MNGTYANVEWIDGLRIQLRSKARTTILLWENCECCRIFRVFDYFMIFVIRDLSAHCSYIFFSMQTPFDAYYIPLISPHTKQQPKQWNIIHLLHFLCFHLFYKNFTILFVMCMDICIHLDMFFFPLLFSFQVCIQVIICSYVCDSDTSHHYWRISLHLGGDVVDFFFRCYPKQFGIDDQMAMAS